MTVDDLITMEKRALAAAHGRAAAAVIRHIAGGAGREAELWEAEGNPASASLRRQEAELNRFADSLEAREGA